MKRAAPRERAGRWPQRIFALGALVVVAAAAAVAISKTLADAKRHGASVISVTIDSRMVHRRLAMTLVAPSGGASGRPLLVFLHGRGGDQNSELSSQMFAALSALGAQAPAIAFPYGGDHSYWHDRADGRWGSYVLNEVIPEAIRRLGADPHRVAIGGISMGGFGAYSIARSAPGRFCAIGGHSAALWTAAGQSASGAFDDGGDFQRHDVLAAAKHHPRLYGHASLWLDGGSADPFHAADEALAAALHLHMYVWPGGHQPSYWNAHWDSYLTFYANALAGCHATA